jgi:hypothetical protein
MLKNQAERFEFIAKIDGSAVWMIIHLGMHALFGRIELSSLSFDPCLINGLDFVS